MPEWGHRDRDADLDRVADALEALVVLILPISAAFNHPAPIGATASTISITGDTLMAQAVQNFTDANGLKAAAPAGNVEAWASDNDAVASIDAATGAVTQHSDGVATFTVVNSGAFLPDGVTAFPDPPPFPFTVAAGAAVASSISVA